jgi:3-oxoacyl-[acyl-carrier-protein] synthase-3
MINAVITGIGAYVPDYILNNEELSKMVDTTDEWIMSRIGIKERHILKGEGMGVSFMGEKAIKQLLKKTNTKPEDIEVVICSTTTPDHTFPSTASISAEKAGIKNAFSFDISAACSGFLYALEIGTSFIKTGKYKKIIILSAEKMSSVTDYTDRTTCPLFGDAATAVLLEPTEESLGFVDSILHTDGVGFPHLHLKAGGSAYPTSTETLANNEHYIHQEGQPVYKYAVTNMAEVSAEIMEKNELTENDVNWLVPHQANLRIIDATVKRTNLSYDKVMINIERYGNTSSASIPLCLWEWEPKLKKGDTLILTAFGAGFTWGAVYLKWGYNSK